MSRKKAFATEKKTVMSLGLMSVILTLLLVALPLLVAPAFLA